MMTRTGLVATAMLLGLSVTLPAGPILPPLPPNGPVPSPLLFVRFTAPASLQVTLYPGGNQARSFPAPAMLGLRPGYIYRVQISGFPNHPGLMLFPSLEVRGTLSLPKATRPSEHPAPLAFTPDDVERVLAGELVTKVVALENPELAIAAASAPDQPLELETVATRDPIEEARLRGRPVMIVRLGSREMTAEELHQQAIPGTILLPGDRMLPPPARPPYMPWACFPMLDPFLGAKPPEEECLKDGGDVGLRAGVGPTGDVQGLDPSDTVAVYSDSLGRRKLAVSNRICVCVPRFIVLRSAAGVVNYASSVNVVGAQTVQGQTQARLSIPSREADQSERMIGLRGREKSSGMIAAAVPGLVERVEVLNAHQVEVGLGEQLGTARMLLLTEEQRTRLAGQMEFAHGFQRKVSPRGNESIQEGPQAVGHVEGVSIFVGAEDTREVLACCHELMPPPPDKPLHLYKWADRQSAQVGEVVTFYLKYSNLGGRTITDVAVSDSLTGRLEYIPGSAKSDRDAVFTTRTNPAGSLVLHWEFRGPLLANQSGIVTFQARVR